jgi:hypothetical protein
MADGSGDLAPWEREFLGQQAARDDEQRARDKSDALILRQATAVMRRRSKRPRSLMLAALVKVLRNWADNIEHGP